MISQTTLLVLGGCVLGTIQVLAGIAIGIYLRKSRSGESDESREEMLQASMIAERLKVLADEMSSSAHVHRSQLDRASEQLKSKEASGDATLAEVVVDVIGDVARANQDLQSQLEMAESRLEEQAIEIEAHISRSLTDPLTGLPNRREFNERLEERMAAWNRRGELFSMLMIDVDHFKKLNDKYGHLAGDEVLAAVAQTLRSAVRREDTVARFGGEEFAVLLPRTPLEQASIVAEKIREAIARTAVQHNGNSINVTASGGLATIAIGDTSELLIEKADSALYAAKASGRNRTCIHDADSETVLSHNPVACVRNSAESTINPATLQPAPDLGSVGTFLERDTISAELAKTCDELRRFVESRGEQQPAPAPAPRS